MTRILAFALATAAGLAAAAPALADTTRDNIPQIFTMTPTGVNLQTGVFVHSETDFTIGSLDFVRSWRGVPTRAPTQALEGDHQAFAAWNHNHFVSASWHPTKPQGVNIHAEGKVFQFTWSTIAGRWEPWPLETHNNASRGASLTGWIDQGMVFTNKHGDAYTINTANMGSRIDRADGTRIDLAYDSSRRLRTIVSSRGDAIVLDYDPVHGRLKTACGYDRSQTYVHPTAATCAAAPVKVSYQYSSTPAAQGWVMSKATDAGGAETSYGYDTYHMPNITCIVPPGALACKIANFYGPQPGDPEPPLTRPDQVRRQTTATGEVWTYSYLNADLYIDWPPIQPGEIRQTESDMTDPLGRVTHAEYENGFLKRLYAPEGLTSYGWAMLNPASFTSPGGNSEHLHYDFFNNLVSRTLKAVPGSGLADIVTQWGYSVTCSPATQKICNQPTSETDPRGNVTDFTYDPAHGGILTETRPAPAAGGVRPQTRYSYAQLQAAVKNSAGSLVPAETSVWVLTEESRCRTLASCAGTADEIRTIHHYGSSGSANALRLRGTTVTGDGVTARTCFGYDALGNRISETGPGGAPATCP